MEDLAGAVTEISCQATLAVMEGQAAAEAPGLAELPCRTASEATTRAAGGPARQTAPAATTRATDEPAFAYALGIDMGSSSVKVAAVLLDGQAKAIWRARRVHEGNALGTLHELLLDARATLGAQGCQAVAVTGVGAPAVTRLETAARQLEDVPAIVRGASALVPQARSIMEIGAQNARFISLEAGRAPEFAMNESCASGTGSFFEDQMSRLGMRIEDFSAMVSRAESVPRLSGRCAVFAKTDIIHRQQEGTPVEDILLGLCYAMVRSYKATIVRNLPVRPPVVLAGGVLLNAGVVRATREVLGLGQDELLVSDDALYLGAAGAALEAAESSSSGNVLAGLISALERGGAVDPLPSLAPLPQVELERGRGYDLLDPANLEFGPDGRADVTLGIDVDSTSTDLVLIDARCRIVDALYLRTGGDAKRAVRKGLAELGRRAGPRVRVVAAATTGSGRERMGKLVGADLVRDEITAQAATAAETNPSADTVFEIGGQDSKFISLKSGQVVDFQMNKVCAAGTGSFVEEQAARMGIPIAEFGRMALESAAPLDLGERCTVFVETAITSALAAGASKRDVAAGLCLSVVRNYLRRVVGTKHVGNHVVLQGGVAFNPGIVAAFRASLGDRLTVSPRFSVSGAVGAALLAREAAERPGFVASRFKGWDLAGSNTQDISSDQRRIDANKAFWRKSGELFLAGYTGERDPAKPTVGIPRALLLHRLFPMANAFFRELGFNTYLTPETSEDTIRAAQASCQGEVCYPVKLVHGHMAQLAEAGVDYVFMPRVRTMRHEGSRVRHNYACVYMQTAPELAARALRFEERGIRLISPVLDMEFGQVAMAESMLGVGAELGFSPERTAQAMLAGGFALTEYGERVERLGDELLASLGPHERVLVIVTRNYGIADPVLNMGIPELLLERGVRVITMGHLRGHDVDTSGDYPEMCWPFGQHILGSARIIRDDPRLFAVYLTNHGCGPDTMLSHLFTEEMGDKPYLQIEVDEHFSRVGVITRLEAFLNALDHLDAECGEEPAGSGAALGAAEAEGAFPRALYVDRSVRKDEGGVEAAARVRGTGGVGRTVACADRPGRATAPRLSLGCGLSGSRPVAVPDLGPCARALALWLEGRGHAVTLIPANGAALDAGQAETTSKEYLTFSMLLGQALLAADGSLATQVLVPRTQGAEADCQYARVIAGVLARRGGAARVVAPALETLAWECEDVEGLFDALLAADEEIARADAAHAKAARSGTTHEEASRPATTRVDTARLDACRSDEARAEAARLATDRADEDCADAVCADAASTGAVCADSAGAGAVSAGSSGVFGMGRQKTLGVVGEWGLVACDVLTGNALGIAAAEGVRPVRMPLAEYLWFLWNDDLAAERAEAGRRADEEESRALSAEELGRRQALLDRLALRMGESAARLGELSPFSSDLGSLVAIADERLGRFAGGGGRYRLAKALELGKTCDGVATLSSMYENTGTILELVLGDAGVPMLPLSFDGSPGQGAEDRLRSFLYFL